MTPERYQQIDQIFQAALALDPKRRSAFLDTACGGDTTLRSDVESLLTSDRGGLSFINAPAFDVAARLLASDEPELRTGEHIDRYEILSLIGSGGMGEVYLAYDQKLNRKIALKLLPSDFTSNQERLRLFQREARAASALNHPNIITIHEVGEGDNRHFIAAEFVEGQTLRQKLANGPLKMREALDIAFQMAMALTAAHDAKIIHRDVKPENIIVRRDRIVKVVDFGLAKLTETTAPPLGSTAATKTLAKTDPGRVMGTVTYMSPEQAQGVEVDARTDLWSLGVVLFEMITGRAPFTGETTSHIVVAILENEPAPLSGLAPNTPVELQRIVRKSLAKDRDERYQTARDLLIDLKSLKQELESAIKPEGSEPAEPSLVQPASHGTAEIPIDLRTKTSGFQSAISAAQRRPPRKIVSTIGVLGLLLSVFLVWYFIWPHAGTSAPPLIAIPLTADPGFEGMHSLSPDGNYVAFIAGGGEQQKDFDLYVKQIGTSGPPLRLSSGPAVEESAAWSPDGRSIAFVRRNGQKMDVFLIPPLGGMERKVAEATLSNAGNELDWKANYLAWSHDSQYLVMADQASPEEPFGLFLFSVATGEKRRLTTPPAPTSADGDPAISPDGRMLAFVRVVSDGGPQLYLLPISKDYGPAGEPRRLYLPNPFLTGPAWTSDGKEIIYSASQAWGSGETRLWRARVSGSENPQPLASVGENGSHASVSRYGNRLVYADWKFDNDIWRVELTGTKLPGAAVKLITSTKGDGSPQYSSDGSRIAFASDRSGHTEIWMSNGDGSGPVQLTSLGGHSGSPRWFPNGNRLVFDLHTGGQADIYSIDIDSRVPRRLTDDLSDDVTPSVSHDGKWIYFASKRTGRMEIWRLPVEGGEAVQVTHKGGVAPIEAANGKVIYYARAIGNTDVWKVSVSGGDETRVLGRTWVFWFAVAADGIYFIETHDQPYAAEPSRKNVLKFYRFATASIEKVTDIKLGLDIGLSVSPDGRYALISAGDWDVSDLKLVENFR